ncbi:MAG: asparagine synthase (glutamine-hydrolyzing) [Candidatus Glassbacteria bacterium]
MCGICGIINRDRENPVDQVSLDRMTDILTHRGPDDRGIKVWDNVGLGHRRLFVIDQEGGHQPMCDDSSQVWITYNGELYNYIELRSDLIQRGYRFQTFSDTEVLIYLYKCYELDMFRHMNGMFSFALFDLARRRVLLARDRMGEKPLYYYQDKDKFLFASEIKSLLTVPGVPREPDTDALHEYLTFQYCLHDRTLFKNIRKLRPAGYMLVDFEGEILESGEYWTLGFEEDHSRSEEHYINELRFLLEDAVKIRLRSDVPVGTYLSGGLDSSIVASMSSKLMGLGLPAFTGYFAEGEKFSELHYARLVAEQNHSPHHLVCPTAEDFASRIERIIYHMDEPAAGPGAFPQLMVSELASRQVKVVLGGQGGDEIFGGYARYLIVYLEECIKGSIFGTQDASRHVVTLDRVLPNLSMLKQYIPMLQRFWSSGLFDNEARRYYELIKRMPVLERYFTGEFIACRNEEAIYQAFEKQFNDILTRVSTSGSSLFNRMTSFDVKTMLQSLLHVEDRMSMAVSLESRLPLLDHRLVELMFTMPPLFKYRNGESKAALKNASRTFLPREVIERKDKMGFPVPFVEWAGGPLKGYLSEILLSRQATGRGLYRPEGIRRLLEHEQAFGRELWGLLCLELWHRVFIDGDGPAGSWN